MDIFDTESFIEDTPNRISRTALAVALSITGFALTPNDAEASTPKSSMSIASTDSEKEIESSIEYNGGLFAQIQFNIDEAGMYIDTHKTQKHVVAKLYKIRRDFAAFQKWVVANPNDDLSNYKYKDPETGTLKTYSQLTEEYRKYMASIANSPTSKKPDQLSQVEFYVGTLEILIWNPLRLINEDLSSFEKTPAEKQKLLEAMNLLLDVQYIVFDLMSKNGSIDLNDEPFKSQYENAKRSHQKAKEIAPHYFPIDMF